MSELPPILRPENFPEKVSEMRPYTDRFRPKSNQKVWLKWRLAMNTSPEEFTSKDGSNVTDWFDDNGGVCILCTVQNSEDVSPIGLFACSGAFSDHNRITECIHEELKTRKSSVMWKVGCRTKKVFKMEKSNEGAWIMADNQMVHVEADRKQAKVIAYITSADGSTTLLITQDAQVGTTSVSYPRNSLHKVAPEAKKIDKT